VVAILRRSGVPHEGTRAILRRSRLPFDGVLAIVRGSGVPFDGVLAIVHGSGVPFDGALPTHRRSRLPFAGALAIVRRSRLPHDGALAIHRVAALPHDGALAIHRVALLPLDGSALPLASTSRADHIQPRTLARLFVCRHFSFLETANRRPAPAYSYEGDDGAAMGPGRECVFATVNRRWIVSSSKASKASRAARINAVISGIQKHFASLASLMLGNKSISPTDLIALLTTDIVASNKATAARAQLATDVEAAKQSHQTVDPLLRFLRAFVIGQFGDTQASADILGDFGMSPRKPRPTNVDAKAVAKAKMQATRAARSTKGSKQKAKVKGSVSVVQLQGSTAGASPTPAASNAPAQTKP
jgi:hypothetical protein